MGKQNQKETSINYLNAKLREAYREADETNKPAIADLFISLQAIKDIIKD